MGSLSPMRTSATSSSMSSLLQGRGNGEPSSATAQDRVTPPSAAQVLTRQAEGPGGWEPRCLGDPGCSPAPQGSYLQLCPIPGRGQVRLCSVSTYTNNLLRSSLSGTHQSATATFWNPTNLILMVSGSQLSQGSGPQTPVTAHQSHTRPRGLDPQFLCLAGPRMKVGGYPYSQWPCQHPLSPVTEALTEDSGSSASIVGHDTESHLDKHEVRWESMLGFAAHRKQDRT